MAWESGGGFFKNMGNMFSGMGKGGGGFMGDFGTGTGLLSGIGQGGDRFGGQFGTKQGKLGKMFGGGQQDVTGEAEGSLFSPYSNELNLPQGADITNIVQRIGPGGAQPQYSPYESSIVPSNYSGHQGPIQGPVQGPVQGPATGQVQANTQLNPVTQAYGDAGGAKSVLAGTQEVPFGPGAEPGPVQHEYEGPWSNEWYDEHGTELEYGPQTEEWHQEHKKDPSNPWYNRGPMQKLWDKFGGKEGLMGLMGGLAANEAAKGTGVNQPQYTPQDPLQFYGGSKGYNFTDVTGGGQTPQYNPLSQGLAGYYNPQLRDLR